VFILNSTHHDCGSVWVANIQKKNTTGRRRLHFWYLCVLPADRAWDIAFQIYDLRKKAGLTQAQLARLVGTKQSNIARIESADYTGYTFKTLEKVTKALKSKLEIKIVPTTYIRSVQA